MLRQAIRSKKFLARLGFPALGALLPLAVLLAIGVSQGFDSEILNAGLGLILSVLATVLGLIVFYVPGWIGSKASS
ncbi:MAG: hypothetical protein HYX86_04350 [Chloroflexi bacterium]|nr:hypothetical protein [Chloroflexota bacterium]